MSEYVYGSGISYERYLQLKSLNDDIVLEISSQTLEHIATRDELRRLGMSLAGSVEHTGYNLAQKVAGTISVEGKKLGDKIDNGIDQVSGEIASGFKSVIAGLDRVDDNLDMLNENMEILNYNVYEVKNQLNSINENILDVGESISKGFQRVEVVIDRSLNDFGERIDWAFEQTLSVLGNANDKLDDLIHIAKTPEQAWAFEQFEAARDCYRRQLFPETIEHLRRAIDGDRGHTGYKTESRFHLLMGKVRLGDRLNLDESVIDLREAENSFVLAARYSKHDNPRDAGLALLYAGWSAYCQGRFQEALYYSENAVAMNDKLSQAHFQIAKIAFRIGNCERGLSALEKAIDLDVVNAVKWSSDDDFREHEGMIIPFIDQKKYGKLAETREFLKQSWSGMQSIIASLDAYIADVIVEHDRSCLGKHWVLDQSFSQKFEQKIQDTNKVIKKCEEDIELKRTYLAVALLDEPFHDFFEVAAYLLCAMDSFAERVIGFRLWLFEKLEGHRAGEGERRGYVTVLDKYMKLKENLRSTREQIKKRYDSIKGKVPSDRFVDGLNVNEHMVAVRNLASRGDYEQYKSIIFKARGYADAFVGAECLDRFGLRWLIVLGDDPLKTIAIGVSLDEAEALKLEAEKCGDTVDILPIYRPIASSVQ